MPQFRRDLTSDRWGLIAENRTKRPYDFDANRTKSAEGEPRCPFCRGNESETPDPTGILYEPGTSDWRVRAVPNKFPAVTVDSYQPFAHLERNASLDAKVNPSPNGSPTALPGFGHHEVIIESPDHLLSLTQLTPDHAADAFRMFRQRLLDLEQDERLKYGLLFKNVGAAAGASLEHTHSQLVALPIVPMRIGEELDHSLQHFRKAGQCVYCEMIQRELAEPARVVASDDHYIALCPFASRFPFETWVLPLDHESHFQRPERTADCDPSASLARFMHDVLRRIERAVTLAKTSPKVMADWCESYDIANSTSDTASPKPPERHSLSWQLSKAGLSSQLIDQSILTQAAYNFIIHTSPFRSESLVHYHWHIEIMPSLVRPAGFEWGSGIHINPVAPESAAMCLRAIL